MPNTNDIDIVRELAKDTAEIAALPVQEETRHLWRNLNALKPTRPMAMMDQVCWNELEITPELQLRCETPAMRRLERMLRRQLYQWNNFRVDMVVEPFVRIPMAIHNTGFGLVVDEETAITDPDNDVVAHRFHNQFETDDDLFKIQMPVITFDALETRRREEEARELFDGILHVRMEGLDPYLSIWDPISTWMGVQPALMALVDRPEFMHALASRLTEGYITLLDQVEALGLVCGPQSLIHCTGAWTDELPDAGSGNGTATFKDRWMFGLAQMFSGASPRMFRDFEIQYTAKICERFGLVYYGCCDPLDGKMREVRMLPNVRKISMSPWVNVDLGAERIGKDYVYSRKPNPALLAWDVMEDDEILADLNHVKTACAKNGCPLEYILKDISTIRKDPTRLNRWADMVMQVCKE